MLPSTDTRISDGEHLMRDAGVLRATDCLHAPTSTVCAHCTDGVVAAARFDLTVLMQCISLPIMGESVQVVANTARPTPARNSHNDVTPRSRFHSDGTVRGAPWRARPTSTPDTGACFLHTLRGRN